MLILIPVGYELSTTYQDYIDPFIAMIVLTYVISLCLAILIQGTAELYAHYFCVSTTSTNNTSSDNNDNDTLIENDGLNDNANNNERNTNDDIEATTTATRPSSSHNNNNNNNNNENQHHRQLLSEFHRRRRYQQIVPGWWYDCMVTVIYEKSYLITGIFIITFVLAIPIMTVLEFVIFMVSINDTLSLWITIPIEIITTIAVLYVCSIYLIIVIPCLLIECNPETNASQAAITNPMDNISNRSTFSYWHILYNPIWSMYRCSQLTKYYRWTIVAYCVVFILLAAALENIMIHIKDKYFNDDEYYDPYNHYNNNYHYKDDIKSTIMFVLGIVVEYIPAIILLPLVAIFQTLLYIELRTIYDKGYYSYNTLQAELQQNNIIVTGTTTTTTTNGANDLVSPLLLSTSTTTIPTEQQQRQQLDASFGNSSSSCVFEVEYGL
jgi:hypothetical protein